MSTEDYRAHIDRLIREMSGETVLNGSHAHATIIIERMFANANDNVSILSRRFDPRIYGTSETIEQAALLLGEPERSIDILLEEIDPVEMDDHPFFSRLRHHIGKNLHIKQVPDTYRDKLSVNFSVMDARGFRFETDKTKAVAVAGFRDEGFAAKLKDLFGSIWSISEPVNLSETA